MIKLKAGKKAPQFKIPDQDGNICSLADYRGKWVLIYFYPKDDTPGCTKQACALRNNLPDFDKLKIIILGVSVNSIASHKKFADKYNLPFTLLADENKEVVKKYEVWGKKKFMGKEYMGTFRTSFLINPEGVIEKIYENVSPETHADIILGDFKKGLFI